MFDEARRILKEAMTLSISRHGDESENVATCHSNMSALCSQQAAAIKKNMRQSVRLDQGSKELRLKPENVRPLIPTFEQRQEQYGQLQDLVDEAIANGKENLRIQVHVAGVKHLNTGIAYCNLGFLYLDPYKPVETREAVAMLTKALRILRRLVDDDDPRLLQISTRLKEAHAALARFEEPGVLSALPCWWPPTSRQEDEAEMASVFAALQCATGSSSRNLSSEAMEQGLRMHGLFNFTASSSDPVDVTAFVAIACNALQKMKVDANGDSAPVPAVPGARAGDES